MADFWEVAVQGGQKRKAFVAALAQADKLVAQQRRVRDMAFRNRRQQALDLGFGVFEVLAQSRAPRGVRGGGIAPMTAGFAHQRHEPLGCQQLVRQSPDDKLIQLRFRNDNWVSAGGMTFEAFGRTGVVAIAPALAGAEHQRRAAAFAARNTGQQDFAVDDARRADIGPARSEPRLDGFKGFGRDNLRDRNGDPFGLVPYRAAAAVMGVVVVNAAVSLACQDGVNGAGVEGIAASVPETVRVEPGSNVLDAHRPLGAVALEEKVKYLANRSGFAFFDLQLLLGSLAALFGFDGSVAERRLRAVPESLAGILQHRAGDVLGGFGAGVLIGGGEDGFGEVRRRPLAKALRHGKQRNAVLGQLAFPEGISGHVTEKARLAMEQNNVERGRIDAG